MNSPKINPAVGDEVASLEAGLDSLGSTSGRHSAKTTRVHKAITTIVPSFIAIALLLLLWTLLYYSKIKPSYLLPSPIDIWHSLATLLNQGVLWSAVGNSLRRAAIGFLASVTVGTILGFSLVRFRLLRMAIGPLVSGLQSLPSVAWVPAAIIWFGLSDAAIYAVVMLGAIPSIANGLLAGVRHVPPLYLRVGRVLGARGFNTLRFIIFPAALPGYFAGLRQGWAFSWRSLMAAELIAFSPSLGISLGQLLQTGRDLSDMSLVLTAIFLILLVGVGFELIFFTPIERKILRTRGLLADS
ncbi:MAG: ABC transporter permease [Actinobacteria bacterium]|nr:ABC transporter permease [Actinomycetota bacterium]